MARSSEAIAGVAGDVGDAAPFAPTRYLGPVRRERDGTVNAEGRRCHGLLPFVADAPVQIRAIGIVIKVEQDFRLRAHVRRTTACEMSHAVGDDVLKRNEGGTAIAIEVADGYSAER